MHLKCKKTCPS